MKSFDVVIVGAGLVGSCLALMLGQSGYQVLLIEQYPPKTIPSDIDTRTMALSHASQTLLSQWGIWPILAQRAAPIEEVCVTVQKQYGSTHLIPPPSLGQKSALGYVVSAFDMEAAITQALGNHENITIMRPAAVVSQKPQEDLWQIDVRTEDPPRTDCGPTSTSLTQVTTRLLIAADGNASPLAQSQKIAYQTMQYSHHAICANFIVEAKSPHTAYERFLNGGALALLPWISPYMTCVWTCEGSATSLMDLSDADYLQACQKAFGRRIGSLKAIGKRFTYPITMRYAPYQIGWRFAVMGNAAHQLHPIAAQGLNLSLGDIRTFQTLLQKERPHDLGDPAFLKAYQEACWPQQAKVIHTTDKIAQIMSSNAWINPLRGMGLTVLDMLSPLKQPLTRWGMGV